MSDNPLATTTRVPAAGARRSDGARVRLATGPGCAAGVPTCETGRAAGPEAGAGAQREGCMTTRPRSTCGCLGVVAQVLAGVGRPMTRTAAAASTTAAGGGGRQARLL